MMALFDVLAGREVSLSDTQWRGLLTFADRTLSTPLLRDVPGLPEWVREEVGARVAKVEAKRARLHQTYEECAAVLTRAGTEFVLLKGFTHECGIVRAQNDVDLWTRDIAGAQRALLAVGFMQHAGAELSHNHVAPLLKPHAWRWRKDYFDPEMPVAVELHYTLWNEARERIAAPGIDDFWDRREWERGVPVLARVDRLGFAALHVLRHVLRNNLRPAHAFELATMVAREENWGAWSRMHSQGLRMLETIAFRLAATWFNKLLPAVVEREWEQAPGTVRRWVEGHSMSPLTNLVTPNKDALRLQLALVPGAWDRWVVTQRRLLPLRLPRREEAVDVSYARFLWERSRYHALALARMPFSKRTSSAAHISD